MEPLHLLRLRLQTLIPSIPLELIGEVVELLLSSLTFMAVRKSTLVNSYHLNTLLLSVHCKATVLIITVYRPPKSKCGFLEDFSQLLSKVSTDYDIIISGDCNIHIDIETDPDAISFSSLLEAFDLSLNMSVDPPTIKDIVLTLSSQKDLTLQCLLLWM